MDLANTFTLEDEIREEIMDNNPELFISQETAKKIAKTNNFPFLNYMYKGTSLKLTNWKQFQKENKIYDYGKRFVFNLFEEIYVDISIEEKPTKDYIKLKKNLKKEKLTLNKVIDIEFFEYYSRHKLIIDHLNGFTQNHIDRTDSPLKEWLKQHYEHEFNDFLGYLQLFGDDNPDKLLDVLVNNSRVDDKKFTTFLDTDKIHLQFVELQNGKKKETVLAYRGYGNHYPFTKNISGKKICDKRYERFDALNQDQDIDYYKKEFNKSNIQKNNFILNWLDNCQSNYTDYFNKNFSYIKRKASFIRKNGDETFLTSFDNLLKLNPLLRTRASALTAYHYFSENSIF